MTGFPSIPAAPPTTPDPNARARETLNWPTIIGVICIVFGIGGTLAGAGGTVWQALIIAGVFGDEWMGQDMRSSEAYALPGLLLQVLTLILGVLLLVGGILLVRRRHVAARWLIVWAVGKVLVSVAAIVLAHLMQRQMLADMAASPSMSGPGAPPMQIMSGMMLLSLILGLLWAVALPTFVLIWFTRLRIRADIARHFLPRREDEAP